MTSISKKSSRPGSSSSSPTSGGNAGSATARRLARQRRPGWIAAGIMLVALAVLANVYMLRSSSNRVSVVRVAREVPVGQQIVRLDVDVAWVAVDSAVATVPGRQLTQVVGKRAAVGLRKGTLLAASQLTAQAAPERGQALVTVPLKTSAVPPGLAPGWRVRAVFTAGPQSQATGTALSQAAAPGDVPAIVDQVGEPSADELVTVSLLVPEADSSATARHAAAEQVVLVVTDRRG
ncbi:hypothetical protein E1264_25365 [Actinomadura sp. KC216]|uniref:hypothetical protein n=1 Tax=Actinomadura sp. KC216 TaxID=2530370 RepID=UPI001045A5AE|nr:hypothetical protein [Actinomadura sp. KC216]TDB84241.1 hypothetical protein E1264_25365 [Actinomadura sp. KC216]